MPKAKPPVWRRFQSGLVDPVAQVLSAFLLLLLIILLGTVGYVVLEGWTWGEALYMTVITVATVGFGEVRPLDSSGRAFTILLIILGVGAAAWAFTRAFEVTLGDAFWSSVRMQRMKEKISRLSGHYIVCGYGRLGRRIVQDLLARGEPFVVVDWGDEAEGRLRQENLLFVRGDATLDEVLFQAGVKRARGLVSALDSDANNVLTVLTARGLQPGILIVARANTEGSESKLHRAGADRVVTPESIGGHRLALALLRPGVHDFLNRIFSFQPDLGVDVGQVTIRADSPFAGQTVAGCDLRRMRNVSILGIQIPGGEFVLNPDPERTIAPDETLILIGPAEAIYELEALYSWAL
jgi:voltage-gated potassium channel